jgi:1,4-dihydroxy-2-naphthoate octaprenyltransferase
VYTKPRPEAPPPDYPKGIWPLWYAAVAFAHTRRFGALYVLGLGLDVGLRRAGVI